MRLVLLASLFFVAATGITSAQDFLRNPSFESRDFSGWTANGKGWSVSNKQSSEGKFSALCSVKKGDAPGMRVCLQKVGEVRSGKIVQVTLDAAAGDLANGANSKASLTILCTGAKGNVVKEYRSNILKPQTYFRQVKIDDAIVLPGTLDVYIMLVVEVYQQAIDEDWWRFDNVKANIL